MQVSRVTKVVKGGKSMSFRWGAAFGSSSFLSKMQSLLVASLGLSLHQRQQMRHKGPGRGIALDCIVTKGPGIGELQLGGYPMLFVKYPAHADSVRGGLQTRLEAPWCRCRLAVWPFGFGFADL